ncbi:MAG: 6-phosphogluconolactonase [Planctomycetota bacterium]
MLKLPGRTVAAPDTETLFEKLGEALMSSAIESIERRDVFHLALSGGGTPEPFYVRLVTDPKFRAIPWAKTHVWVVDERQVPEDHNKSNWKMLRESLVDHLPIPAEQLHPMPVMEDDPAGRYEAAMEAAFGMKVADGACPRLDFVLLGMGGDCHTASLFPESPALCVGDRWICENDGEKVVPPPRLTMTYPLLNAAWQLAVLVVGKGKHAALGRVHDLYEAEHVDAKNVPISGLEPTHGTLTWYGDHAALGAD